MNRMSKCQKCGKIYEISFYRWQNERFCRDCFEKPPIRPEPSNSDINICPNCKTPILPKAKFCPECGVSLSKPEHSTFLSIKQETSSVEKMRCPFCKEEVQRDASICPYCKKQLLLRKDLRDLNPSEIFIVLFVCLFILLAIIYSLFPKEEKSIPINRSTSESSVSREKKTIQLSSSQLTETAKEESYSVGSEVYLYRGAYETIRVNTDPEALKKLEEEMMVLKYNLRLYGITSKDAVSPDNPIMLEIEKERIEKINKIILQVPANTKALVLSKDSANVQVKILEEEYAGKIGWVSNEWVRTEKEIASSALPHVTVTGSLANIRSGPGTNYSVVSQSSRGNTLELIERGEDWIKVKTNDGKVGWVHGSLVE